MSVPVFKRKESKTEYLNSIYDLNVKVGEIVANGPKKYINTYGTYLIHTSAEAMKYAQTANKIFMNKNTSKEDYLLRREMLIRAKGDVENISTIANIYLDVSLKSKLKKSEIYKRQEDIGLRCYRTIEQINGVMRYDSKVMSKQYSK